MASVLRQRLSLPWSLAKGLCETGKVFALQAPWLNPAARVYAGLTIDLRPNARAPLSPKLQKAEGLIAYEDSQVVVIDKPAGIQSVPYERGDTDTAMDLLRDAWRAVGRRATQTALHIVHRLDKDSSGLLLFAKTKGAERALQALFRQHNIDRRYRMVVHGRFGIPGQHIRIESRFVADRGDGLRGSLRPHQEEHGLHGDLGKKAVTHVHIVEVKDRVTVCEAELETGKTHQIRIHLAERGHPLLGERVYIRDFLRHGGKEIPSPRLLLHAQTLGFAHPESGEEIALHSEPKEDFLSVLAQL